MSLQDERVLEQWLQNRKTLPTVFYAPAQGAGADRMVQFCEWLKGKMPSLGLKNDADLPFQAPTLVLGRHRNIAFQAAPEGKLLTFFLEAMALSSDPGPGPAPQIARRLEQLKVPMLLTLYVADACPHCPVMVSRLLPLAAGSALVRLEIVEAGLFAERAAGDQIRSVPTLILDGQYRWTGQVELNELLQLAVDRDASGMSAATLRQMLEAGEAPRAAEMMAAANAVFPALIELILHPRWSVRLGAMVTVEYLADGAPLLAARLADLLWERFVSVSEQIQGDVAHALGLTKSPEAKNHLEEIVAGSFTEEVRESAAEALVEMEDEAG